MDFLVFFLVEVGIKRVRCLVFFWFFFFFFQIRMFISSCLYYSFMNCELYNNLLSQVKKGDLSPSTQGFLRINCLIKKLHILFLLLTQ